jgi:hypothetical protein
LDRIVPVPMTLAVSPTQRRADLRDGTSGKSSAANRRYAKLW